MSNSLPVSVLVLVIKLQEEIKLLTDEQRLELRNKLFEEYCSHCGRYDADTITGCQCWNDE